MKTSRFFLPALLLLTATVCAQEHKQQVKPEDLLVRIPNSVHRQVATRAGDRYYDVYIHYPAGYDTASRRFPVLYVVDGENDFSPAIEYLGLLVAEFHITEPILVAIGEDGLIGTPKNKRNRDFTPTKVAGRPESGGAGRFLDFIRQDLIPSIDSTLKTDRSDRSLYGYSMGGLFATYVLFEQPGLFKNILIGSPALGYDSGSIFTYEKAYAGVHKNLSVNVFMEVGEFETPAQRILDKQLSELLNNAHYQGLNFKHTILFEATHLSGKPNTMLQALRWAYTGK